MTSPLPSPLHARAASGDASNPVKKPEPARRPLSDCRACSGTGRVHIQHKRPFRVESRECDCWRVVELAEECDRHLAARARLQGDAP